jgi:hypothetical protein
MSELAIGGVGVLSNVVIAYVSNKICWQTWDWLLEALKALLRKWQSMRTSSLVLIAL